MKSLIFSGLLFAGCAGTFGSNGVEYTPGTIKGYCLQAEGLSGERCYKENATCLSHESILRDRHPWSEIKKECSLEFYK